MFNKKNDLKIEFLTNETFLLDIKEVLPKPSKQFMPKWWKDIPSISEVPLSIKACPSFPDYFSQGYVLPMWADTTLNYDVSKDLWKVHSGLNGGQTSWDIHSNDQFLNLAKPIINGKAPTMVFKAISPWFIKTPPGWSVLQLPLFYEFDNNFSVLPGIIDTDIHHEINQQVLYFGDNKDLNIKRGQPFVQYIPFKRTSLQLNVRSLTESENKKIINTMKTINSKFMGSGVYRSLQRERDKGE